MEEVAHVGAYVPSYLRDDVLEALGPQGIIRTELGLSTMTGVIETGMRRLLMEARAARTAREVEPGDVPA